MVAVRNVVVVPHPNDLGDCRHYAGLAGVAEITETEMIGSGVIETFEEF
jgi:hypothetical protein